MSTTEAAGGAQHRPALDDLERTPLIDTMVRRRSRRFALGHELDGGPFTYRSRHEPLALTPEEEAVIVFAGTGVTGFSLGELPYDSGREPETGHGIVMVSPYARTISSADGINSVVLFVLNDDGAFQIRRPQDYPKERLAELVELAGRREYLRLYEESRIRVASERPDIPRHPPYVPPFNRWSANVPGSTYFLLVSETTTLTLTILFLLFSEEMGFYLYDERNAFRPAGVQRFRKSRGGHLHDDPNELRMGTILELESYVLELVAVEQGLMLQNMELASEALGLGCFPHYGAQKYTWFEALGFRTEDIRLSRLARKGRLTTALMNAVGKNPAIAHPLGLDVDGTTTLKPYCPPYYASMEEAVHAFVDRKFAEGRGIFRDGSEASAWKDPAGAQARIPTYSQANVDAVVAYCEYVYGRYGRFLANFGPLRSLMAFQVHHIDQEFYDRFYKPGAYHDLHREHMARWHDAS